MAARHLLCCVRSPHQNRPLIYRCGEIICQRYSSLESLYTSNNGLFAIFTAFFISAMMESNHRIREYQSRALSLGHRPRLSPVLTHLLTGTAVYHNCFTASLMRVYLEWSQKELNFQPSGYQPEAPPLSYVTDAR